MRGAPDVIVVGAGHNGLTAAALLAARGRRVLVLERREVAGGLAADEEFHPGYRAAGVLHDTTMVRTRVARALRLERHGLRWRAHPPGVLALGAGGLRLRLDGEPGAAARHIAEHSARDAERYLRFREFAERVRPVVAAFVDEPPVDPLDLDRLPRLTLLRRALRLRRLGRRLMGELLRVPPMSVEDWLAEWFETRLLRGALALPALAGAFMGPRSPGSAALLLLREAAGGPGVAGGAPMLVAALERAAREHGASIRTGAAVERVLLGPAGVCGVALAGGERLEAPRVALSCDPRHALLDLLPAGALGRRAESRLRGFRARGIVARVLLALRRPPDLGGAPAEVLRVGADPVRLERAFDAVKYREMSERPVLEVHLPQPGAGLAPYGGAVASVLVHFAPHELEPPWDDARRERLGDRVVRVLDEHLPGLSESIEARCVLSPADLERRYGVTGGHLHHGEHALDQLLVRPSPECAGYRTPVPGLYLCGGGSHPGGGVSCAPGALAARVMLGD